MKGVIKMGRDEYGHYINDEEDQTSVNNSPTWIYDEEI